MIELFYVKYSLYKLIKGALEWKIIKILHIIKILKS